MSGRLRATRIGSDEPQRDTERAAHRHTREVARSHGRIERLERELRVQRHCVPLEIPVCGEPERQEMASGDNCPERDDVPAIVRAAEAAQIGAAVGDEQGRVDAMREGHAKL